MAIFEYENDEAAELHRELILSTNGTEPCYDPYLVDNVDPERIYESYTDLYVENFTNRSVTAEQADERCRDEDGKPCHVREQCAAFAFANGEPFGIWGGTTPRDRGFVRGKRVK